MLELSAWCQLRESTLPCSSLTTCHTCVSFIGAQDQSHHTTCSPHSPNKYLLNTYYMAGNNLDANETGKKSKLALQGVQFFTSKTIWDC